MKQYKEKNMKAHLQVESSLHGNMLTGNHHSRTRAEHTQDFACGYKEQTKQHRFMMRRGKIRKFILMLSIYR